MKQNKKGIDFKLREVRAWAQAKIDAGQEPPWAWFQYMKLIETTDIILNGISNSATTGSSLPVEQLPGNVIRLAGATYPRDTALPHPDEPLVPLPM